MCISGCSVGTVLSAFLGRVSLSSSIISITPEPAKKLWLCVPFASMVFLIAQREDVCVCVYASMHLCKNSTSSKCMAWLDISVIHVFSRLHVWGDQIHSPGCGFRRVLEGPWCLGLREWVVYLWMCFVLMTWLPCVQIGIWTFFPLFSLLACFHQPTWDRSIWEWILSEIYSQSELLCYWRVSILPFTHHLCATAQSLSLQVVGYCLSKSLYIHRRWMG